MNLALSIFQAVFVLSDKIGAVLPHLLASSMLLVHLPLSRVLDSIPVDVLAKSVGMVVLPLPRVNVAFLLPELTLAVRFVFEPFPLIDRAVEVSQLSIAFSQPFSPLSDIAGPVGELHLGEVHRNRRAQGCVNNLLIFRKILKRTFI